MRNKDEEVSKGWVQIEHPLLVDTAGGKQKMNCANTADITRSVAEEVKDIWFRRENYK